MGAVGGAGAVVAVVVLDTSGDDCSSVFTRGRFKQDEPEDDKEEEAVSGGGNDDSVESVACSEDTGVSVVPSVVFCKSSLSPSSVFQFTSVGYSFMEAAV